ncbi:MAG: hypothetical protein V3U02_00350 [Calditrichia bacterium]
MKVLISSPGPGGPQDRWFEKPGKPGRGLSLVVWFIVTELAGSYILIKKREIPWAYI